MIALAGSYAREESSCRSTTTQVTVSRLLLTTRDITERKRHRDELAKAFDRVEAASRARSEFLAGKPRGIVTRFAG
jgi:hypothetical protein